MAPDMRPQAKLFMQRKLKWYQKILKKLHLKKYNDWVEVKGGLK